MTSERATTRERTTTSGTATRRRLVDDAGAQRWTSDETRSRMTDRGTNSNWGLRLRGRLCDGAGYVRRINTVPVLGRGSSKLLQLLHSPVPLSHQHHGPRSPRPPLPLRCARALHLDADHGTSPQEAPRDLRELPQRRRAGLRQGRHPQGAHRSPGRPQVQRRW